MAFPFLRTVLQLLLLIKTARSFQPTLGLRLVLGRNTLTQPPFQQATGVAFPFPLTVLQ